MNLKNQIIIEPPSGILNINIKEIWHYHELLYFLIWRDIKIRYRQTLLGAIWAMLQPILTMVVFSIIFGNFAKLPSDGVPYPIFTFVALLPWQLFSTSLSRSSESVVGESKLLTKIYFPRLIIPISSVGAGIVDFLISSLILIFLLIFYSIPITWKLLAMPFLILLAILSALSVGIWFSALNVKYRDIRYTIPFLVNAWMFATPIAYSATLVPDQWRTIYGLNPMVGVIEGFRWMLLDKPFPDLNMFIISILIMLLLLISGLIYFSNLENYFADVI